MEIRVSSRPLTAILLKSRPDGRGAATRSCLTSLAARANIHSSARVWFFVVPPKWCRQSSLGGRIDMRKLLLAVVFLLTLPLQFAAASNSPSAPENSSSPAAQTTVLQEQSPGRSGDLQIGTPEPLLLSCSATYDCPTNNSGGTTQISCTGASSCNAQPYQVTCDGQTTYCGCVSSAGCTCICDCLAQGGSTCALQCKFSC